VLNEDPLGAGWVAEIKADGEVDLSGTMSAEEYAAYVKTLGEE
jgi:glycine cleavage system H lipoate-binding protein